MTSTLFDQLGGATAVDAAVDIFYRRVLSDDLICDYFDGVDMDQQRAKQKSFLTLAFGGPNSYSGKNMRDAHKRLVDQGLGDAHFDAVAGHLQGTLEELGVPADLIAQVMAIAGSTRNDVLNR